MFAYTVAVGDEDTDGVSIGASKLALNGGAIEAGALAAALTHPALVANASHKVDGVRPTLEGATATGSSLELVYSEALDTGSEPAPAAFAVTVAGTPRNLTAAALSGSKVTLTLASAVTAGEAVAVSYTKPGTDPLRDLAGNQADSFSGRAAGTGTTVSTVALTSSTGTDSTYAIGDTVQAAVTFAAAVEVTGTPRLELDIGGQPRQANYAGGGGTAALVFAYTVAVGDEDTDGIAIGASKLALNGGAIEAGGVAAALTHPVLAANASHKVDGVRPTLEGATATGSSLELMYSEALDTGSEPAPAAFTVTVAGTPRNVTAVALSGSKVTLTLASAVTAGETVAVSYTKPGTDPLRDLAGNQADSFSGRPAGSGTTVSTMALTSGAGSDMTYAIGDVVQVTVTFAAAVEVTGAPRLELDIGGQPRQASYASGGGTAALVFAYTVAVGDEDTDGIAIGASKLALNGGAIEAGALAAALAHPVLAANASHKVDGVRPTLEGASATGSSLELVYSEALDTGSEPAPAVFAVTVAGTARNVTAVTLGGSKVTLTLASAVTAGEAVAVSYTKPQASPLRDLAGNEAGSFSGRAVDTGTAEIPELTSAMVDGATLTLTYTEALDTGSVPATSAYSVTVDGLLAALADVDVEGSAVTLTLSSAVQAGQVVTVSYAVPGTNPVQSTDGTDVVALTNETVTNITAANPPELIDATVDGARLTLTYNEELDSGSVPATSAYTVTVEGSAKTVKGVTVTGPVVTLTLESAVQADQVVTVSYAVPGTYPVQDVGGTDAAALANEPVTNSTPEVVTVKVVSTPPQPHHGSNDFKTRFEFSEEVEIESESEFQQHSVEAFGGQVTDADRLRGDLWETTTDPDSDSAVVVALRPTEDCAALGALCTAEGKRLIEPLEVVVPGPNTAVVTVGVVDAEVEEGSEAAFDLDRTGPVDLPLVVRVEVTQRGDFIQGSVLEAVTFPEDGEQVRLSVPTVDDSTAESTGLITVRVLADESVPPVHITGAKSSASVAIRDNDQEPVNPEPPVIEVETAAHTHPPKMALWTDRPGYRSGERMRLFRTMDPKGDRGEYQAFIYLENIVTGERRYFSPGIGSQVLQVDPVDHWGRTEGAYLVREVERTERELTWEGLAPEPSLWHFVAELKGQGATGAPTLNRAYAKFVVASKSQFLNRQGAHREVDADLTLRNDTIHYLRNQLIVRSGAVLKIEKGTLIKARNPSATIVVERGGKIVAEGTRKAPVVLTCDMPFGLREPGCWAGVQVLGQAPVTRGEGSAKSMAPPVQPVYGGSNPHDSSGLLRYVRVEFAGAISSAGASTAALGLHGVGDRTEIKNVQTHSSLGSGIALHGGTVVCDYCVSSGSREAGLAWERGWRGAAQHLYVQNGPEGLHGIDGGNDPEGYDLEPRSRPTLSNATLVHSSPYSLRSRTGVGVLLGTGTGLVARNVLVLRFGSGAIDAKSRSALLFGDGTSSVSGAIFYRNGYLLGYGQVRGGITSGVDFQEVDPMLRNVRYEANPDPRPARKSPALKTGSEASSRPDGELSTREDYTGSFGMENWLEEWTFFGLESDYDTRNLPGEP